MRFQTNMNSEIEFELDQNQHGPDSNSSDDFDPNDPNCITKFLDRQLRKSRFHDVNNDVGRTNSPPSNDHVYLLEPVHQKSTQELQASTSAQLGPGLN